MVSPCLRTPALLALALVGCLAVAGNVATLTAGQPPDAAKPFTVDAPPSTAGSVKEVQPPILFLRSKDGGPLQAVLGFSLEDFEKLIAQRAQSGLGQQPPRFQVERIAALGKVVGRHADVTIEITIIVNQPGWVRVPLRLAEAVLRSPPRYRGPGQQRVEFDLAAKEHVLWLQGEGEQPHRLTLDLAVPLEKLSDHTEMKLGFPRSAIAELTLTVPAVQVAAVVREGGLLEATKQTEKETEFKVLGMDRDFAIAWSKEEPETKDAAAPIEAQGVFEARVDGSAVHTNVQLTVSSVAAKFDAFRLRLPGRTSLIADEQPNYSIEPVDSPSTDANREDGLLYEVRLPEKTAGPVVVHFSMERPHPERDGERAFEISGVELVGAARQSGYVAVAVSDDWNLVWGVRRNVRQVDDLPVELDLDHKGILASFEYFTSPFAISGQVAQLKTHVTVESQFDIDIDSQQARLAAKLTYQVRGAKAFAVAIAMQGWVLDDVAPRTLFDVDRISPSVEQPLRVPLWQPATGAVELLLKAHRDLPADAKQVEFVLPQPTADAAAPAKVLVTSAANVTLDVRDRDLVGLTRPRGGASGIVTPGSRSGAFAFRGENGELRFAADLRIETRTVSAEVRSLVHLDEPGSIVEETMLLTIANDPLDELVLDVPAWLEDPDRIEWRLDGQLVRPISDEADPALERTRRVRLPLAERRLGTCQLVLKFPLRMDSLSSGTHIPFDVPLVMPAGVELTANQVTVTAGAGISVQPRGTSWNTEPAAGGTSRRAELQLSSPSANSEVALQVRRDERLSFDPTVVERAWIQTRLARSERWERVVYQFTSGERQVTMKLPPGALAAEARAVLDGAEVSPRISPPDALSFDLPPARRLHVLEVSYRLPSRDQQYGRVVLAAPSLATDQWIRQTRWQLVLPRDEYVVYWPAAVSSAFRWRFQNGMFWRQPLLEQPDLEAWVGATPEADLPDQSNRYVFTSLGAIDAIDLYTSSRTMLVLVGAGGVLAAGLLLLYVKKVRHPAVLFLVGVVLVTGAILFPEPTLLVAQVAALGAALVVMAVTLERQLRSRRRVPLVVRAGSSSIHDPASTRTHLRTLSAPAEPEPASHLPQATAPQGES